jgi:hypothetical protein
MSHPLERYRDLIAHTDQVAGSRLSRVVGGSGDGALILTIWTPGGLEVELQVDRALDILSVRHRGVRYGWAGPSGLMPRLAYEPGGYGWQRTFYGGLLTTCGLEHVGDPAGPLASGQRPPGERSVDYGEHGRIGHAAADIIERGVREDASAFRVRALVSQGAIYDERLELHRTIDVDLHRAELRVTDTVTNQGPLPARHAILYHLNFGYPVSVPGARVHSGAHDYTVPELTATSPELVKQWTPTGPDSRSAWILTPAGHPVVACTQSETLPSLFLWNAPRSRTNVLGLAPSSLVSGDEIDTLAPGASRTYQVRLELGQVEESESVKGTSDGQPR